MSALYVFTRWTFSEAARACDDGGWESHGSLVKDEKKKSIFMMSLDIWKR
jgi:hypothetical protein